MLWYKGFLKYGALLIHLYFIIIYFIVIRTQSAFLFQHQARFLHE